jgi:hypothetical protein
VADPLVLGVGLGLAVSVGVGVGVADGVGELDDGGGAMALGDGGTAGLPRPEMTIPRATAAPIRTTIPAMTMISRRREPNGPDPDPLGPGGYPPPGPPGPPGPRVPYGWV